jgi:hypothetical protein
MRTYTQPRLIPIIVLLHSAVAQVRQALSMLFRLMLIRCMIEGMLLGISVSLFFTVGSSTLLSHAMLSQSPFSSYLLPFSVTNVSILIGGIVVVALLYCITACMLQIATIFAVSKKNKSASLAMLFHVSISRFLPFIISQLLCWLLIVGGLFACILPGIGMLLFFSFVPYVVLFEGKSGVGAIGRSVTLIAFHPFSLIGRLLLVWTAYALLNHLFSQWNFFISWICLSCTFGCYRKYLFLVV